MNEEREKWIYLIKECLKDLDPRELRKIYIITRTAQGMEFEKMEDGK